MHSTRSRGLLRAVLWYVGVCAVATWITIVCTKEQCLRFGPVEVRQVLLASAFFLYTCIRLFFLLLLKIPSEKDSACWVNDKAFTDQVGVLIPCHLCAAEIAATLRATLRPQLLHLLMQTGREPHV